MAETSPAAGKLLKAVYTFKGSNNDELCFRKNDIITITQQVEGGWWEGTLNEKTGWFPSNYVTECDANTVAQGVLDIKRGSVLNYHQMVLQNLVDTERQYVTELQQVIQSYLHPIHTGQYLTPLQYNHLVGNIDDLVSFHVETLNLLETCSSLPHLQQRVGGLFLKLSPQLRQIYKAYYANHPWAVSVMLAKKDDLNVFMESKGLAPPGTMELTTCLSKPFNRLEQYASSLKELERHIEDSHPDRGDTQRAFAVCKDIAVGCIDLRKQKEVECEIMSDTIDGIDDEITSSLGTLVHLANVTLLNEAGEKKHAVLALFQNYVLYLYISSCMSGYEYQGRVSVNTVSVTSVDDTDLQKNAFEINTQKEKRLVICLTSSDKQRWLDLFVQLTNTTNNNNTSQSTPSVNSNTTPALAGAKSTPQLSASQPVLSPKALKLSVAESIQSIPTNQQRAQPGRVWSMSCLRPSAPMRPTAQNKESGGGQSPRTVRKANSQRRKAERTRSEDGYAMKRIEEMKTMEEDAVILQVIEAYCTSSRTRHTVNSSMCLDAPQMLIVDEERIILDGVSETEEKSLVDTIYTLRDHLQRMQTDQKGLRTDLNAEVRSRRKLETFLKRTFKALTAVENGEG